MTASPLIPRRERIVTWGNSVRVADSAVALGAVVVLGVCALLEEDRRAWSRTLAELEGEEVTIVWNRYSECCISGFPTLFECGKTGSVAGQRLGHDS